MKQVLEVDGVMLDYGHNRVLQDVFLKCETGKVTGVLGRNGVGKSSLFRIIFGELTASAQSVRINNNTYTTTKRPPADIRYLPQHHFVPAHLTIGRLLNDFEVKFSDLVAHFPEFQHLHRAKIAQLSAGQRRIVEVFLILVAPTEFCILDEPFSQIMPLHVDTIKRLIIREKEQKGIILSDHMYLPVCELSDDLYLIRNGTTHLIKAPSDLERLGYVNTLG